MDHWTAHEIQQLSVGVEPNWDAVAGKVQTRTADECRNKWNAIQAHDMAVAADYFRSEFASELLGDMAPVGAGMHDTATRDAWLTVSADYGDAFDAVCRDASPHSSFRHLSAATRRKEHGTVDAELPTAASPVARSKRGRGEDASRKGERSTIRAPGRRMWTTAASQMPGTPMQRRRPSRNKPTAGAQEGGDRGAHFTASRSTTAVRFPEAVTLVPSSPQYLLCTEQLASADTTLPQRVTTVALKTSFPPTANVPFARFAFPSTTHPAAKRPKSKAAKSLRWS
tara:strand:- start:767 stop:1615 length:849 start_codon:yes stop_codon:yes gene_type:complete